MARVPICWLRDEATLLWAPQSACPPNVVAFATDDKPEFAYVAFNKGRDFGPLDLSATVLYCRWVDTLIQSHKQQTVVHITTEQPKCWSNTVTLCGAYLILAKGYSAQKAFEPFAQLQLPSFVDCRGDTSTDDFELSVLDVLSGLQHARDLNWIDFRSFPTELHSKMLRPEHGDMTWLLQGKAVAMASPWTRPFDMEKLPVCTAEALVPFFLQNKVGLIIQCNHPTFEEQGERQELLSYEPKIFENAGIRHLWLPFEDGGCPSVDILQRFLSTAEAQRGAFAVHCRSGLGRTATLIGAYGIRHFKFTARSFIGWSRVARPGTVHGSQQQYLVNLEPFLRMGASKALSSLTKREQLELLPPKELHFWALDLGIEANGSEDLLDLVLAHKMEPNHSSQSSQSLRPADPGPARRALLHEKMEPWAEVQRCLELLQWPKIASLAKQIENCPVKEKAVKEKVLVEPPETHDMEKSLQKAQQDLQRLQKELCHLKLMTTGALAEASRETDARLAQLREERERELEALQSAKQRLNEPWESAKHSLDRLRMRLQAT